MRLEFSTWNGAPLRDPTHGQVDSSPCVHRGDDDVPIREFSDEMRNAFALTLVATNSGTARRRLCTPTIAIHGSPFAPGQLTPAVTGSKRSDFREPKLALMHRISMRCWPEKAKCEGAGDLRHTAMGPGEAAEFTVQPKTEPRKMQSHEDEFPSSGSDSRADCIVGGGRGSLFPFPRRQQQSAAQNRAKYMKYCMGLTPHSAALSLLYSPTF